MGEIRKKGEEISKGEDRKFQGKGEKEKKKGEKMWLFIGQGRLSNCLVF